MQCYIESDGKLFLIRRDGILDLPQEEKVQFSLDRIALTGKVVPNPDEMTEARYFPLHEAKELVFDTLIREVIASLACASSPVTRDPC